MINHREIMKRMKERFKNMSKEDWEKLVAKAVDDTEDSWTLGEVDGLETSYYGMKTRFEVEEKRDQFKDEYRRMKKRTDSDFSENLSMIAASIRAMDWVLGDNIPLI